VNRENNNNKKNAGGKCFDISEVCNSKTEAIFCLILIYEKFIF
jgi:hypothetical protein